MNTESDNTLFEDARITGPMLIVVGIAGASVSSTALLLFGRPLIIAAIAAGLLQLLFITTTGGPRHFRGAIAVAAGHLIWLLYSAVVIKISFSDHLFVPVAMLISTLVIALLWARPSLKSALMVGAFQVGMILINLYWMLDTSVASVASALAAHILLRVLVLALLVTGLRSMRAAEQKSTDARRP